MNEIRKWHKGPPPHIGWWNASSFRWDRIWRWWDGSCWSWSAKPEDSADEAAIAAGLRSASGNRVEWTDYWPENARVPRVAP